VRSRHTRQLDAIERVLQAADRPLAIAEIHSAAAAEQPGLGIATIYRAIKTLSNDGKIVSLAYAGQPPRYEWAVARDHSHFICHGCRRVFDIEAPKKVPLPKSKPRGFVFSGEEVIYYGTCADCRPGRKKTDATN